MTANRNIEADRDKTLQVLELINQGELAVLNGMDDSWLDHSGDAGQLDRLLAFGATLDKLSETRGAVDDHIYHLRTKHGLEVVEMAGVYRITVPK
jgi:hypothetical protein